MEAVLQFMKEHVGRFGMFSLVLLTVENILDDNFVCPCKSDYKQGICFLYAFVPALGCLICTLMFVDVSPQRESEKVVDSSSCSAQRILYAVLTVLIWVSLFFADGRYLACAYSDWGGLYTKSDTLGSVDWCKPPGNKTSVLKSQQKTLEVMSISQFTGFSLMIFVIGITAAANCCCQKKPQTNTGAPEQSPEPEELSMMANP